MSRTLHIADGLALPLDAVTQTFAILATRGSGKTYTAMVLAEEMLRAHVPVVVLDPVGVWWGLRASADGKGPGLPITIFGGDHGDLPLEATAGTLVADLVVDERVACVLDLSLLRKAERTRFVADFAERLYHRNRQALHLIVDEADAFAPQRPMHGEERMLGAMEDIVRRGRARGLGITLVTQRAAVINKDVLTQTSVLVTLRMLAPQDHAATDAWIQLHGTPAQRDELMRSLASLPIGTAWFWSPGWLGVFQKVKVRTRETFDSSATPKVGVAVAAPRILARVDLERIRGAMAATVERAAADDPKVLRARVAELEHQLRVRQPPEPERVEVPVLGPEDRAALTDLRRAFEGASALLNEAWGRLVRIEDAASAATHAPTPAVRPPAPSPRPAPRPAKTATAKTATAKSDGASDLRKGARRMLDVLARYPQLSRIQLGTLAGFTPTGGTFGTYLGDLKRAGFIDEDGTGLFTTPEGVKAAGGRRPALARDEILAQWHGALRAGACRMLDVVIAHPRGITREQLADRVEMEVTGGTFSTYLGDLRRNGLIEVDRDAVRPGSALQIGAAS